ncbi:hypothetical protein J6590_023785 [Homalodisca vitripennis]|nr:hypothetical protein J6590_023785 [Homalodisca vitripennis]
MRLKLTLLCGYDKYLRPVLHHSNKTEVKLLLGPRIIEFDDMHSSLYMKAWVTMWHHPVGTMYPLIALLQEPAEKILYHSQVPFGVHSYGTMVILKKLQACLHKKYAMSNSPVLTIDGPRTFYMGEISVHHEESGGENVLKCQEQVIASEQSVLEIAVLLF